MAVSLLGLAACSSEAVQLKIDDVENLDCGAETCQHVIQVTVSNWEGETTDRNVRVEWAENSIQALGEVPFTGNTSYLVNLTTTGVPDPCEPTVTIIASLLNTSTSTTEIDEISDDVIIACNNP